MSDENQSLGDILGGASAFHAEVKAEPKVEAKPEPVAEPAKEPVKEKAEPVRDEAGKFAKAEPEKAEPKTEPEKPLSRADVAAIIDERRKRQDLERELSTLRAQQLQETKPPPSVFEDEDGAISARVNAQIGPLRSVLLQQSVTIAQLKHGESWSEAESAFYEAAERNPQLVEAFRNAADPGEFVYQQGIFAKEMAKHGGSIVAYRDAIRGESSAKLAEQETRIKALETELAGLKSVQKETDSLPKSLNNRASAQVTTQTVGDQEDIAQIVRFNG